MEITMKFNLKLPLLYPVGRILRGKIEPCRVQWKQRKRRDNEEWQIRMGGKGGEERDQNGPKNKNCFQFKNDYIKYDAKNLKMKHVVQLVNLFITEFSASS
jgi:hypothetical protein